MASARFPDPRTGRRPAPAVLWACAAAAALALMGGVAPDTDLLASGGAGAVERPGQAARGVAWIPDGVVRAEIERALGKRAGAPIWIAEMAGLTTLDLSRVTVSDLTGLEHAVDLRELFFGGNASVDLSPLYGLAVAVRYTTAPGLGNLVYDADDLWEPISTLPSRRPSWGHGRAFMADGHLNVIWGTDSSVVSRASGIDTWDVSDPRFPTWIRSRTSDRLRQAHSLGCGTGTAGSCWSRRGAPGSSFST